MHLLVTSGRTSVAVAWSPPPQVLSRKRALGGCRLLQHASVLTTTTVASASSAASSTDETQQQEESFLASPVSGTGSSTSHHEELASEKQKDAATVQAASLRPLSKNTTTTTSPPSLLTAREKRRQRLGLAKAVDRGQYAVTYQPGGLDGRTFQALSGLPYNHRDPVQHSQQQHDTATPQQSPATKSNPLPSPPPLFVVLGIESSCDDTGAAIVRSDGIILGEALASQHDLHEEWGGVMPGLARDAHQQNIHRVIQQALDNAGLSSVAEDVDAIGVTVGPGLEICLRVGCTKARELALQYNKPFVGVHHLEAHILMARLPPQQPAADGMDPNRVHLDNHGSFHPAMEFPFLALLVSGGHCQLLKCIGIGSYSILGGTVDDSLGEAFDKTARLLGLPVGGGGGPALERLASEGDRTAVPLSIPLQARKHDFDFSYSGLKTNVRRAAEQLVRERHVDSIVDLPHSDKANIAASFQHVAITHIEQRLARAMALMEVEGIDTLAVVGGVAANQELRRRLDALCETRNWTMVVPPPRLCTDQGSMSAWAAVERLLVGSSDDPTSQDVYARYPFATIQEPSQADR